ncbi:hypothetical protein Tco_0924688 [Tanacetum coccineum]|uniref:Uncharacterized protein n=1 Tax=Tanacetum coccineum TaxID=301880 RepID=A0ABQ5DBN7_9ASTR
MIDDEEARDNFMKDVCTFLRKFSRIPFGVTPMVILIAWESFGEIKDALMNNWNRPLFYFDDDDDEYAVIWRRPKAITPDEPIKEPDNSLSMGDEHLSTIPETESDEVIKSRCENHLSPNPKILSDSNDDDTSSDDDDFEDVEYVSLEEVNDEKEFDLEDIFQIQDVILREKLLNIHRLISNIESLKVNPTPDRVLKSPSPFPIPVADSDSFLSESDTSLSHLDNSLPEFETFSDHTESDEKWQYHSHANNYSFPSRMIRLFLDSSSLRERLFSHFSPTPRFLLYLAPLGVKIRSLTPTSPLRAGGISSGWNFHETSKEILQARDDLMEAIQAFLKEYDHIPPNEKCMALLLAEERFLKIKQAMEEEHNQPEVLQELLLKLISDLQILKGIQQEEKKPTTQSSIPHWNFSMINDEEARDNFMKDVCTFLRKFSRIPLGVTPKVILIAWEIFGEIKKML